MQERGGSKQNWEVSVIGKVVEMVARLRIEQVLEKGLFG